MAKPSFRNRQVVRQWQILKRLEETPTTLRQLRLEFDVTDRTIRRDLAALEEAGFPIYDTSPDGSEAVDGITLEKRWGLASRRSVAPNRMVA